MLLFFNAGSLAQQNLFRNADVFVSTANELHPGTAAVDGLISRKSTWISAAGSRPPHILELSLPHYADIDSITMYTGIPEEEKSISEKGQSAGFWNVKNFVIQYWDDANWTDISETLTTENRLDKITFRFPAAITSFRFRLVSADGEAIRIIGLEGYGKINKILAVPVVPVKREMNAVSRPTKVNVRIGPEITGRSMKYVGYNQGYYMPNSNVSAWLEYSGVNSVRVWAGLSTYASEKWLNSVYKVETLGEFEKLKQDFLSDPERNKFISWDSIAAVASRPDYSTNSMVMDYAFEELNKLGIDIILQISNASQDTSWENKWKLWQRYYALAFYAAKKGNVQMFAMQNEPNHRHAGPMPLDVWIELMKVVSDAVHCAVDDVNRLYKKDLKPQFVGPVTAGTNTNWWAQIAAAERVDYKGEKCDRDLIDLFSTHSYNLPAAGYLSKVQSIDQILRENHPLGHGKPILFTEIGRWMNAYLIDKEETMDSPSLFTEWAGIYTNIMKGGGYGMWAFKFANTASSTYPRGIKSGHHHIWKGKRFFEDSYENLALGKPVNAIATDPGYHAASVTDGDKSDASAWTFTSEGSKWLEIDLEKEEQIGGMVIYTGSANGVFTAPDRIRSIRIDRWTGSSWTPVPGASEENSRYAQLYYSLDNPVKSSRIRITTDDPGKVMIREVKIFGPHTLSTAPESYDVSGVQRTAEVVRLFAKGFKGQRPLLSCELSVEDPDLDVCASVDSLSGNIYVWLVQRNLSDYRLDLDLNSLGIRPGTSVVYEQVGHEKYGEATILTSSTDGILSLTLPKQSVGLLTICPGSLKMKNLAADQCALVKAGIHGDKVFGLSSLAVELDARTGGNNQVSFIHFSPKQSELEQAKRIVLGVHGYCEQDTVPYRFHVYFIAGSKWKGDPINWQNAPCLNDSVALAEEVGTACFVAGELTMNARPDYHYLDVTDVVKKHASKGLSFMLIREGREPGDDYDKGRFASISSIKSKHAPILKIWEL
jgi:hypothetical protein